LLGVIYCQWVGQADFVQTQGRASNESYNVLPYNYEFFFQNTQLVTVFQEEIRSLTLIVFIVENALPQRSLRSRERPRVKR